MRSLISTASEVAGAAVLVAVCFDISTLLGQVVVGVGLLAAGILVDPPRRRVVAAPEPPAMEPFE